MGKVNIVEKDGKKYIDGEEVLYSYECTNSVFTLLRILFFTWLIYFLYIYFYKSENILELVGAYIFAIGLTYLIYLEINNLINRGFHITKNHLITFSAKKVAVENIMYRYYSAVEFDRILFYNNKKFIQFCLIKDDDEFRKFISTLKIISDNNNFIYDEIDNRFNFQKKLYITKKLIIKGENNG